MYTTLYLVRSNFTFIFGILVYEVLQGILSVLGFVLFFSPVLFFHSRVIGVCPVTTDWILASVCVLHVILFTRRHPAHPVSMLILHPVPVKERYKLCGHKTTTRDTINTAVPWYIVMREVDNAMPCHCTGYDRHTICTPATQIRSTKYIEREMATS